MSTFAKIVRIVAGFIGALAVTFLLGLAYPHALASIHPEFLRAWTYAGDAQRLNLMWALELPVFLLWLLVARVLWHRSRHVAMGIASFAALGVIELVGLTAWLLIRGST